MTRCFNQIEQINWNKSLSLLIIHLYGGDRLCYKTKTLSITFILNCSFKVLKIKPSKDASRMQYDHFRNLLTAINSWIWFKLSEASILSGAGGRACLTCSLLAANSWGTCSNCTNTGISPIHSTCAYCVTYGTLRWGENKKKGFISSDTIIIKC